MPRNPLDVVAVVHRRVCTFEFGIVVELFGLPRPELDPWYRFRVAAVERGPLPATGGVSVHVPYTLRALDTAGTIVIPGWGTTDAEVPQALVRKIRRAHEDGARIASVCSGAFALAASGLLDGRRAATHWKYAGELARRFPDVEFDADVLYVDDGNVITSAGSAAGIDMCLHLVRRDFGSATANQVARRLVVPPHREGGQQQFVETPVAPADERHVLSAVLDSVRSSLDHDHSVDSMAKLAGMSSRSFARRFRATTGSTPHRWLQAERTRRAQLLLETTELSMDAVAERAGFSDVQILRLHFKRIVGTTPSRYRSNFREGGAG
ncbi:MAG: transcriptional regulator FtrA [Acidobacteriota bacterium]